ncbi:MAG: RHS repeat protein, partial [Endozoicomonadaceae bacterium]|nr:RHS repeat protein [Endozoicomonadaceae bacterium]
MLTNRKQKYIYFFLFALKLLCHIGNLFCTMPDIQKNRSATKYTSYFYHSDNPNNQKINKSHTKFTLNPEKKRQLTASSSPGESSPWSNAFNFKKVWGTTVDPRTGILSAWIKTGSMLSNLGHGPDINLNVNYNSSTLANPDGLGEGWGWNLTHFNPATHQLITSFGQNFYLKKQFNGYWKPLYYKLHDMFIQGDISTHFVITYANGLRETLNHGGYEIRLEQQDGWSVRFSYVPGTHLLKSIKDDEGHIIKLHRTNNYIAIISQGNVGQQVFILIHKKDNEIHNIILPYFDNHTHHGIYFHYLQHFMTRIDYPTGLKKQITYNCSDEIKIPENYTLPAHALCAVVKETTDPGFGQPVMVNHYRYGKANINEHNYLGFNAGLSITDKSPQDKLFEAPVSYTYQTGQDNGLIREVRTYNKYHLMTDEQQISDRTGRILSAVHYFFCRADQYDGCAHSSFADLPATYSLPLKIITQVFGEEADVPATTIVTARYDEQGRVVRQKDLYGRVNINHYCPLTGNAFCPAASAEWPFSTLTESTIQYPANTGISKTPSPVTIWNYYKRELNHNGKGYISVLDHQIEQSGKQQITVTRHYYQNAKDLFTYGLLKQMILTGQLNETNTSDAVIKDYYYVKSPDSYTKTTYSAIELSDNKRLFSPYTTTSLFTNQVLMVTDTEKKHKDRYCYDSWDRLIRTERAVGTNFAASTHYSYTISKNLNQVLITAVNGLQQKIIFDSIGRVLTSFTEAIDKAGKKQPWLWWPVQKNYYDQHGYITRQSSYIISKSGDVTVLNTTRDYDDTGRSVRIHLPDGSVTVMRYNDSNRCVISYHKNVQGKRSVISISLANRLSKPVKQWILPATNVSLPSVRSLCLNSDKQPDARVSLITYDGFGRQIAAHDPVGRIVRKYYDSMGRLTDTIDPAGNRTHSIYNLTGQTVQSWVYPVSGEHYLLSSASYNRAGQLIWHAGEDGKRTIYTYTVDGQIATITTPNQHIFSWQYNLLNLPVSQSIDNKQRWYIYYDPITLEVQKKTDITGTKTYFYSDDGLTQQLIFSGNNNYSNYKLQWEYDKNRHIVSATDISGNKTHIQYDWLGRVSRITYHPHQNNDTEILSLFAYDYFSRIKQINYGS